MEWFVVLKRHPLIQFPRTDTPLVSTALGRGSQWGWESAVPPSPAPALLTPEECRCEECASFPLESFIDLYKNTAFNLKALLASLYKHRKCYWALEISFDEGKVFLLKSNFFPLSTQHLRRTQGGWIVLGSEKANPPTCLARLRRAATGKGKEGSVMRGSTVITMSKLPYTQDFTICEALWVSTGRCFSCHRLSSPPSCVI